MSAAKQGAGRPLLARAALLGAGLLVGWLLGQAGDVSAPPAGEPGAARGLQTRAGVTVGFDRTREGAAAAAASYQRAFASPSILSRAVLRRRIEAVAMPDYAARMLAVNAPGTEQIAAGPIGEGLAAGVQTIYSAVPIGYEVESFTARRARVLTWGFTLLGNASAAEPAAYFGLSRTELAWADDGWRIAAIRASFGPTPKLATAPAPGAAFDVIALAKRLQSYELAP